MANGRKVRLGLADRVTLGNLLTSWCERIQRDGLHVGALLPLLRAEMPGVELTESHIRYAAGELDIEIPRQRKKRREQVEGDEVSVHDLAARLAKLERDFAAHMCKLDEAMVARTGVSPGCL